MERDDIPETGSTCPKCKEGRVALVSSMILEGDMDQEPYTNGVVERDGDTVVFEDYITFVIYACDHCGHVYSVLVDTGE